MHVRAGVDHLGRYDDVSRPIDRRLRIKAVVKAAASALHDPGLGIGKAVLRFGLGHAKVALVRFACLWLAVLIAGAAFIAWRAPALRIGLTLARLQSGFGRCNGAQALLLAGKLCRDVQFGDVLLKLVCVGCLLHQGGNLGFVLKLGRLHPGVGHGFVAAGVGLDLCAIDCDSHQIDQAHLACQANDLHKQFGELRQVQSAKLADRAVGRKVTSSEHPKANILVELSGYLA